MIEFCACYIAAAFGVAAMIVLVAGPPVLVAFLLGLMFRFELTLPITLSSIVLFWAVPVAMNLMEDRQ